MARLDDQLGPCTCRRCLPHALIGQSITTAIGQVSSIGGSTVEGAVYVLDLSIFIFLISFEIPKMAGNLRWRRKPQWRRWRKMATKLAKLAL